MTNYRLRQLGHRLKTGDAEAWIVYDYTDTGVRVEHVDVGTRPSWSRYYHAPACDSGATATGYASPKPIW